jgi:hypothetical protein
MIVGLYDVIQEMGIFPMSVANNFYDMPLPKYLDSKTVLIYCPHPVYFHRQKNAMTGILLKSNGITMPTFPQ